MALLALILIVVSLFATMLAYETSNDPTQPRLRQYGLWTWLISGNWPAKVGAGLVIVGVGALLRYALINVDLPPAMKLGSGVLISALLGTVAKFLKRQPARRAVHLALAGAAFGVAYLTAYGAYGLLNYINDINALALMALVAVAAGIFAVTSNAMSVAILAMVGAYIAPKFAIGTPGVVPVYGYYLAASILSMIMVAMRGWRPLIHLSFLFTLAGALFFGSTGNFYRAEYYGAMEPLLLALTAVHLAMPLLERKHSGSAWLKRFDIGYFIALPLTAAILSLKIAPEIAVQGAIGLAVLALIWAAATVILAYLKSEDAARHGLVAALLAVSAVLCCMQDVPWSMVGLGITVGLLLAAPTLRWSTSSQEGLCSIALALFALDAIRSVFEHSPATAFFNEAFAYRLISGLLLTACAWIGTRRAMSIAKMMSGVAAAWMILIVFAELWRLNIDFLPQLVYGVILGMILLSVCFAEKLSAHPVFGGILIFLLTACGWWAMHGASDAATFVYLALTPVALISVMWSGRDGTRNKASDFAPAMALGLLPFAILPWAGAASDILHIETDFFELLLALLAAAAAGLSARLWLRDSPRWNDKIQPLHFYGITFVLLLVTLFHIERSVWAVASEIVALSYLLVYVSRRGREATMPLFGAGMLLAFSSALVFQAMLLRLFGPPGILSAADINHMHLPAMVSLMWAVFGAGLAWWGTQIKSRSMWSSGAILLIAAAVKLVFFDFGTLGQLGNILAFIASGLVFLGVAYFAPIPPKSNPPKQEGPKKNSGTDAPGEPVERKAYPPAPSSPATPSTEIKAEKTASTRTAADIRAAQARTGASTRYREEPAGANFLWIAMLGLAIIIVLASLNWQRHLRRERTLKAFQAQLAQERMENPVATESPREASQAQPPDNGTKAETAPDNGTQEIQPSSLAANPATENANRPVKVSDICTNFIDRLPSDYVVYAAGAYSGRRISPQAGQMREPGQFDVSINVPEKNVVLALGAYEPSNWNIHQTSSTKIVGVLLSGYHSQKISYLASDIPVLRVSHESNSPCGFFFVTPGNAGLADQNMRRIFGKSAESYSVAMDGRVEIGAVTSSSDSSPQSAGKVERYVDEKGNVGYRQAY